jgi:hypothetical protein
MKQREKYPFVRAWGKMLGSHLHYIDDQIYLAEQDQAPADAIYRIAPGKWAQFRNVGNRNTLDYFYRNFPELFESEAQKCQQ